MLIRIVKMNFQPESLDDFLALFARTKDRIAAFEGCRGVRLLRDLHTPATCMTYSYWENEEALERYRASELFRGTWAITKTYFAAKPEAWSLEAVAEAPSGAF